MGSPALYLSHRTDHQFAGSVLENEMAAVAQCQPWNSSESPLAKSNVIDSGMVSRPLVFHAEAFGSLRTISTPLAKKRAARRPPPPAEALLSNEMWPRISYRPARGTDTAPFDQFHVPPSSTFDAPLEEPQPFRVVHVFGETLEASEVFHRPYGCGKKSVLTSSGRLN